MLTTDGRDGLTKYHDDYCHYLIFSAPDSYKDSVTATSEYPAYIAKASVSLEPYVNKKVKYG